MSDTALTPAGRPNLLVDRPPRRDAVGDAGLLVGPTMLALPRPEVQTNEQWRAEDDARKLALASQPDRDRLAKEQKSLASADAAVAAAEGSVERARASLIEARVEGWAHAKAEQALTSAEAALTSAKRSRGVQADVVEALRGRLVERVRQDLARRARAELAEAQAGYDGAVAHIGRMPDLVDAARTFRAAEAQASAKLADAEGLPPGYSFSGHRAERATGTSFRTCPEEIDRLRVVLDRPAGSPEFLDGGAVAGKLARRSLPIDAA